MTDEERVFSEAYAAGLVAYEVGLSTPRTHEPTVPYFAAVMAVSAFTQWRLDGELVRLLFTWLLTPNHLVYESELF